MRGSGRQRRGGRFTATFCVAAVAVLLGSELLVRAADDRLAEPLIYFSPQAQQVAIDLDVLHANGIRSDIAFVGTSMVRRGIDANRVEGVLTDTEWAHNVALPGAQTTVVRRWLHDEVVPKLRPRRVVWGISSIDFNGARPDKTIDRYEAARASEPGFFGDLDRRLLDVALSHHRDELRDPAALLTAARGNATTSYERVRPLQQRAVWELAYPQLSDERLARLRRNHLATIEDKQLFEFAIGDDELEAFRATLRELQDEGIEVAVVFMPVPTGYADAHPGGAAQFEEFKATIAAETAALDVTTLDLSTTMSDDDFRDYEHLWVEAAHRFTDLLAERLLDEGW